MKIHFDYRLIAIHYPIITATSEIVVTTYKMSVNAECVVFCKGSIA